MEIGNALTYQKTSKLRNEEQFISSSTAHNRLANKAFARHFAV